MNAIWRINRLTLWYTIFHYTTPLLCVFMKVEIIEAEAPIMTANRIEISQFIFIKIK